MDRSHKIDLQWTPDWLGAEKPVLYEPFEGRFAEMWAVHSALHRSDTVLISGAAGADVAQVAGLGGIGKTLLAKQYAVLFGPAYAGGIFWLRAHGNDDSDAGKALEARESERQFQVRTFAERFSVPVKDRSSEEIEGALGREIERRAKTCLWVVDDLPSGLTATDFQRWLAPHPLAKTLITTRSRAYHNLGSGKDTTVNLDVLPERDALVLLTSRRKPIGKVEEESARCIVHDLGAHPLAVDVAGAALAEREGRESFAEFRTQLARQDTDSLDLVAQLAHELPTGHERSITNTLLQSIRRLSEPARDFLRLASVLAVAPISSILVQAVFASADNLPEDAAAERIDRALHEAEGLSLCARTQGASTVHTLVSRVVRFRDPQPVRTKGLRSATVNVLQAALGRIAEHPEMYSLEFGLYSAHARWLSVSVSNPSEVNLITSLAQYDFVRGDYRSAELEYRRALEFLIDKLGPEHRATLATMTNLATTLSSRGMITDALTVQKQALSTSRVALGSQDPDTLMAMGVLANVLLASGALSEARDLLDEVLRTGRKIWGPRHRHTMTALKQLAEVVRGQGDLKRARALQEEVLTGLQNILGREHSHTLSSASNLAMTLQAIGEVAEARELQEEVLKTGRAVLGPQHPETLVWKNNLAEILRAQGETEKAKELQEEVLRVRLEVLGPVHPNTLASMNNLAGTLQALGDQAGAHRMLVELVSIAETALGPHHPNTLNFKNNLGELCRTQGDLVSACKIQEEVMKVQLQLLGSGHPDTLRSMNNLGLTLWAQKDFVEARKLQQAELAARRRVHGSEHPDTIPSMISLATTLQSQGDLASARKLQEEATRVGRRVLGPDHPLVLTSMNNLALTLQAQGELVAARKLYEETLVVRRRVLGREHPDTSLSAWNLVQTLGQLGDKQAALKVVNEDLLWLHDRDPKTLDENQRSIRQEFRFQEGANPMALRNGYILFWMHTGLVTLETGGAKRVIPVFSTEQAAAAFAKNVPLSSNDAIATMNVWMDADHKLKYATVSGGVKDLLPDETQLDFGWDTDPGFDKKLLLGLRRLKEEVPDSR